MFSATVEYALRAMAFMAGQENSVQTTEGIASAIKVPRAYLSKVLQDLNRAKLIKSQRGLGGGISFVKSPAKITLLDIIQAVDPSELSQAGSDGSGKKKGRSGKLQRFMEQVQAELKGLLERTTLQEVAWKCQEGQGN